MAWPFQRGGKSSGNRKHSKIDKLPPEMKATVEEMILTAALLIPRSWTICRSTGTACRFRACRYAQGYVENLQTL